MPTPGDVEQELPHRIAVCTRLGFDPETALAIAEDHSIDLAAIRELVARGCPAYVALAIVR